MHVIKVSLRSSSGKHISCQLIKSGSNVHAIMANTYIRNQKLTTCMWSGLAFSQAVTKHISRPLIKLGVSNVHAIMANVHTYLSKANNTHAIEVSLRSSRGRAHLHQLIKSGISNAHSIGANTLAWWSKANNAHVIAVSLHPSSINVSHWYENNKWWMAKIKEEMKRQINQRRATTNQGPNQ